MFSYRREYSQAIELSRMFLERAHSQPSQYYLFEEQDRL